MKEISLTQGMVALVDDEDYERVVATGPWQAHKARHCWYADHSLMPGKTLRMSRLIVNAHPGQIVDHANGDGLDNRKANLRICTNAQNCANQSKTKSRSGGPTTSRFKGVSRHKCGRWQATICIDRVVHYLGLFGSELDASNAYDVAALQWFGEFARPNLSSQ